LRREVNPEISEALVSRGGGQVQANKPATAVTFAGVVLADATRDG
jgi:hypothetical protein